MNHGDVASPRPLHRSERSAGDDEAVFYRVDVAGG